MSEDKPLERLLYLCIVTALLSMVIAREWSSLHYHRRLPSYKDTTVDDNFSGWSEWTACSRSCGSGISTRNRVCKHRYAASSQYYQCPGSSKQIKICNIENCPDGEIDFRKFQCAVHNNREIAGKVTKKWIPVAGHRDCELKCQSTHHKIIYTFGKATDGTKCHPDKDHVCINGRCQPVGCDLIVGSTETLDECGICGGRNNSCSFISDVFRGQRSPNTHEYQEVAFIPAGASRIRVEESSGNNHLALLDSRRRFVVNGKRELGWAGTYSVAGTKVRYSRSGNDESFSIQGPTKENLYIMVLMYETNKGISYQYWLTTNRQSNRNDNRAINTINERRDPREHYPQTPRENTITQSPESNRIPIHYPEPTRYDPQDRYNRTSWTYKTGSEDDQYNVVSKEHNSTIDSRPSIDEKKKRKNKGGRKNRIHNDTKYLNGSCGRCERVTERVKHFCDSEFVIRAKVIDIQQVDTELRYAMEIIESYKNTVGLLVREFIWANDPCRCPKLRRGVEYILMGRNDARYRNTETRLLLERTSFTRKFNPKRGQEMKKLRQLRNLKCHRKR